MKDLFSINSSIYQQARPRYSQEILQAILQHVATPQIAWDCGAGSGQFTELLTPYFQQIYATDLSAQQLSYAPVFDHVEYRVASEKNSGLAAQSVDLVTVAQAIHWFNFDSFYAEVSRVLKPNGLLAVIGYGLIEADEAGLNSEIQGLYFETLKGYWDTERRYVDELYQTIPFPFQEIAAPSLRLSYKWTPQQLLDYFTTWSGLQHYLKQHLEDPLQGLIQYFSSSSTTHYEIHFPVVLRMGKLENSV